MSWKERSPRLVIGAFLTAVGAISSAGCSSSNSSGGDGKCSENALTIAFSPMYSAYESGHTYQVPAIVSGVASNTLTWSAADPSIVSIADDPVTGGAMLTLRKAGTTTITAQVGNICGTSVLTVEAATADEWTAGSTAYNTTPSQTGSSGGPTCANCHGASANNTYKGISHTPEQTGGYSDSDLDMVLRKGEVPDGGYFESDIVTQQMFSQIHKFSGITDADLKGLTVYLRSLTPAPQTGTADFGGHGYRDGGYPGPHRDGGYPSGPPDAGSSGVDAGSPEADAG